MPKSCLRGMMKCAKRPTRREPLRHAVGTIAGSHAATHDQARLVWPRLFQDECPSGLILAVGQSPGKNQAVFGLTLRNEEHVLGSGERRKYTPYPDTLILGQDVFGAAVATVVDEVVGVPSGSARAHLGQPRPHVSRRATNRDGVIDRADRLGNQVVSGKSPGALVRSSADLHVSANRKYREHYRYSENEE